MNRWVIGIAIAVLVVLAVPVLALLALMPMRAETVQGGPGNQAPGDLHALTVHDRLAIDLSWTVPDQGTATYVLQRSTAGGDGPWEDIVELEHGSMRYLDQGLEDGVTYFYRIRAFDAAGGSGFSNVTSATATDLPRPE